MARKGQQNHYNVKFLKGYGFSIKVKDSKIILKNTADPFSEPEIVERFFAWLKCGFRRMAIRCERRAENYLGLITIASIMMYCRVLG